MADAKNAAEKETTTKAAAAEKPAAEKKAPAKKAPATTPAEVEATASAEAAASKPAAKKKPAAKDAAKKPAAKEAAKKPAAKDAATKPAAKAKPAASRQPEPQRRSRNGRPVAEPAVQVHATAKYVRTSARKARLVCDHIRGKDVQEARAILAFTPRAAAKAWSKLLESAVANAEHNHELVGEELRVYAVLADEGPTLKRFRPRAMGRATRIRKRTSHLTITLTPKES
jgi:ribosomal protein L22